MSKLRLRSSRNFADPNLMKRWKKKEKTEKRTMYEQKQVTSSKTSVLSDESFT